MRYWNNIIQNILLFVPIGLLIGNKQGVLFGICLSIGIELTQLVFKLGYSEADDVLNNAIGVIVGNIVILLVKKLRYIIEIIHIENSLPTRFIYHYN